MVIVDTSVWIEAFRKSGQREIKERVAELLQNDEARFCDPVLLELKNSLPRENEREKLLSLIALVPILPTTALCWQRAGDYAQILRKKGVSVPVIDLLIRAVADENRAKCFSVDSDFAQIEKMLDL